MSKLVIFYGIFIISIGIPGNRVFKIYFEIGFCFISISTKNLKFNRSTGPTPSTTFGLRPFVPRTNFQLQDKDSLKIQDSSTKATILFKIVNLRPPSTQTWLAT